jgi:DNA-binding protein YbaB
MEELKRILGFDPEFLARDADRLFEHVRRTQGEASTIVGRAESADGRVKVEYTSQEGVRGLELDPRALRAGSADLAETIVSVIARAREDFAAQGREILAQGVAESPLGPAPLSGAGRAAEEMLDANLRGSMELVDQLRELLRK